MPNFSGVIELTDHENCIPQSTIASENCASEFLKQLEVVLIETTR